MDMSKVRAKGPWVLVKVDPPVLRTKTGLYLPEGNAEQRVGNATGTVLSAGEGKRVKKDRLEPMPLEVGDKVMFRGFLQIANRPGGYLDKEHSLLHIDDIIGVVEG